MTSNGPRVAVIQYPGTNCEIETKAVLENCGITANIFRWNAPSHELSFYDGFVIPGGFSYQDRVRAGAIAAKKSIGTQLIKEAEKGKPILGICNGAQILVETGLIPGLNPNEIQMSLAANQSAGSSSYLCDWVHLKCENISGAFTRNFSRDQVIPIPIAHAEGRFTTRNRSLLKQLQKKNLIAFRYCTEIGRISSEYPVNPNGSMDNIAGLYNAAGNVMALMPHPERAAWLRQLPQNLHPLFSYPRIAQTGNPDLLNLPGPGKHFFLSMKSYMLGD